MADRRPRHPCPSRLPSLNAVRGFAVAGRCRNFTEAAAELGVTQGAVSRLVQTLEDDLGQRLFERQGQAMVLTPAGAAYHREVEEAIDRIARASRTLRGSAEAGFLSINAVPTFAARWLIPRLPAFQARHPDIAVDVTTGDGRPDTGSAGHRLFIRFGEPPFGDAVGQHLMSEETAPVCAPRLLPSAGRLAGAADLLRLPLLHHTTRPESWDEYLALVGLAPPPPAPAPSFEHVFMLAEAAAAGMGVALLPLFLVRDDLAAGRLVQALPVTMRPRRAYYLLHDRPAGQLRSVRLFKAWIASVIAGEDRARRPGRTGPPER